MSKRKSLADQVGEQAVTIDGLKNSLSQHLADFAVLASTHDQTVLTLKERDDTILSLQAALGTATANVGALTDKITKLEADLKSKEQSYTYKSKACDAAEAEIEQAHATLNTIPEAIPAEYEKEYGKGKHSLSARFMGTLVAVLRGDK